MPTSGGEAPTAEEGRPEALAKLATELQSDPNATVHINGHSSSRGNEDHDRQLSKERADAVTAALGKLVPKSVSLTAKGFGSSRPITDHKTEKARAPNRCVEIFVRP